MKLQLLFFLLFVGLVTGYAQSVTEVAYIEDIEITGNKRTKSRIILRELLVRPGDTIPLPELAQLLQRSEELVMNTGLFIDAQISFKAWEGNTNRVRLSVQVNESWYLFPVPVFELADRNFNIWWVEEERSLDRVNVGIDFAHLNISGRKDQLKFSAKYGYTRRYSVSYRLPFINRAQTIGLAADAAFFQNREINYLTEDNRQAFFQDGSRFLYERFRTNLGLTYRPKLLSIHQLVLGYRQNRVDDVVVAELNPDYFLDGRKLQRFFVLNYRFTYDQRDASGYPWRGYLLSASLLKDGLGVFSDRNALQARLECRHYIPMGQRWSWAFEARSKLSLIRTEQPYNDNRAMGFGNNYVRGFEYYLMDGLDMGILKGGLRFRALDKVLNFGRFMPIQAFRRVPVKFHLTTYSDLGYANSPYNQLNNPLNNRILWGGGIGLDIVFFFDKVIQIEYSFNDLMENGLFLHLNMNI